MNEPPRKPHADGYVLKVRKFGNSTGIILPKELLARLNIKEVDKLHVVEQNGNGVKLSIDDPTFSKAMDVARKGMKTYLNALAELAK